MVPPPPDLSKLTEAEKDALILRLLARLEEAEKRIAELEARLREPPKTPGNSSLPPSTGQKANRPKREKPSGPRQGSIGRQGGGRPLAAEPDQVVVARAAICVHCHAPLGTDDHVLHARYDKIDLPPVRPVVTRVERYLGRCRCCGGASLAPVPVGLEEGSPFSASVQAAALYLRFVHAISYQRLARLFGHLFAFPISEGALDAMFRRAKPSFDGEVDAILARLRRARIIGSDETTVRVNGRTHWNWVFQNEQVVIHVIRPTRGRAVVEEVLGGHRPQIWVSDLFGAQRGSHADEWQVCLAHQLRDLRYAIEAGDDVFAPRLKALLLRAILLARRRFELKESTRLEYRRRLERELTAILALQPSNRHGQRLQKRYRKVRNGLFTFLTDPAVPPDNNASERELRPMATYRKVTGGFRSDWGPHLCAAIKSVVGTAARQGIDAYHAIRAVLFGATVLRPG
jgi:transposase